LRGVGKGEDVASAKKQREKSLGDEKENVARGGKEPGEKLGRKSVSDREKRTRDQLSVQEGSVIEENGRGEGFSRKKGNWGAGTSSYANKRGKGGGGKI